MKCPYCKIHYMDDDRECPMCGAPNPSRGVGKLRPEKKTRTASTEPDYPSIRRKGGRKTRAAQTKTDGKSLKIGVITSAAVVIISLVPTVVGIVSDLASELTQSSVFVTTAEEEVVNWDAAEAPAPEGEYLPPESAYQVLPGEWIRMDGEGYLYLDLDSWDYAYALDGGELESGYALVYEVDQADNGDGTIQYGYQVDFYPDYRDTYGYSLYLSGTDAGSVLTSMEYGADDYVDVDSMMFWTRRDALEI